MKRLIQHGLVVLAAIAGIAALAGRELGAQANAQPKKHRGCTSATIAGSYGIQISGTRPAPGGATESVVGVVIRHYDGFGQFTQVDNVKGSITGMVPDRQGFGTYSVNEDCSGVAQLQPGPGIVLEERLVIVGDGNEIRSMTALPALAMVTGVHQRVDPR
jgi:hypothetical protein